MSLKKTAKQDAPHATFTLERAGWEWRVLKTYKAPAGEAKDQYARWFVAATSPHMQPPGEFEMGDTYKADILGQRPRLVSCTQEFADAYPELLNVHTLIDGNARDPIAEEEERTGRLPGSADPFVPWMAMVEVLLVEETGLNSDDLPDKNYREMYQFMTPKDCMKTVLAEEGYEA